MILVHSNAAADDAMSRKLQNSPPGFKSRLHMCIGLAAVSHLSQLNCDQFRYGPCQSPSPFAQALFGQLHVVRLQLQAMYLCSNP